MQEAFPKRFIVSPWTGQKCGRPRGPNYKPGYGRRTGRGQQRGERRHNSSLTVAIVMRIKELRRTGIGAIRICELLGVDGIKVKVGAVQAVIDEKTWRHV